MCNGPRIHPHNAVAPRARAAPAPDSRQRPAGPHPHAKRQAASPHITQTQTPCHSASCGSRHSVGHCARARCATAGRQAAQSSRHQPSQASQASNRHSRQRLQATHNASEARARPTGAELMHTAAHSPGHMERSRLTGGSAWTVRGGPRGHAAPILSFRIGALRTAAEPTSMFLHLNSIAGPTAGTGSGPHPNLRALRARPRPPVSPAAAPNCARALPEAVPSPCMAAPAAPCPLPVLSLPRRLHAIARRRMASPPSQRRRKPVRETVRPPEGRAQEAYRGGGCAAQRRTDRSHFASPCPSGTRRELLLPPARRQAPHCLVLRERQDTPCHA
jgi:hypothetical protein